MFEGLAAMSADGIIAAPMGHASSVVYVKRIRDELPIVFVDYRYRSGGVPD